MTKRKNSKLGWEIWEVEEKDNVPTKKVELIVEEPDAKKICTKGNLSYKSKKLKVKNKEINPSIEIAKL